MTDQYVVIVEIVTDTSRLMGIPFFARTEQEGQLLKYALETARVSSAAGLPDIKAISPVTGLT